MNAIAVLGIVGFCIWWVHRSTTRRRRPGRPTDEAYSHALLPSKKWG